MPEIHPSNRQCITSFENEYQRYTNHIHLRLFRFVFFPGPIMAVMANQRQQHYQSDIDYAFALCRAIINHTEPYQRSLFRFLRYFLSSSYMQGLTRLHEVGLLNDDEEGLRNFEAITCSRAPFRVATGLLRLHEGRCLTSDSEAQANRDALMVDSYSPEGIASVLVLFNEAGYLTGERAQRYRDMLVAHIDPALVSYTFELLNNAGLLRGEIGLLNVEKVFSYEDLNHLHFLLSRLARGHALNQASFNEVITHADILCSDAMNDAWDTLPMLAGLTADSFSTIIKQCQNDVLDPATKLRVVGHSIRNQRSTVVLPAGGVYRGDASLRAQGMAETVTANDISVAIDANDSPAPASTYRGQATFFSTLTSATDNASAQSETEEESALQDVEALTPAPHNTGV